MYNTIIQSPNFYRVGLYIRLSEADENKSYETESESIVNQRNLLLNYVKQNGFSLVDEYVDDGFTGTNFDRPGFNRLIEDIENGRINCVITKDLSRLGRDYIKCGYYVEQYFPQKKVRYISILDQVDTFLETANNDIAPFKALFNDMTSKDTSKKIRSILKNKKEQGKFIGSEPSFGYMRDPLDKGHLIPNPEVAPIVKKIFEMAKNSVSVSDIATYLNNNKYPTPSLLKKKSENTNKRINSIWTVSSVKKILKNRNDSNYYLYDMNSDGIPELFIVSGDSEATKEISVYTYTDNPNLKYADDIVNVGVFGCGHGNIYLSNDGQLVIFFAHMGYQHYTYYKLENDWLVRTYYSGDEYIESGNEYRPPENVKEMITIPSSDLSLFDNYK